VNEKKFAHIFGAIFAGLSAWALCAIAFAAISDACNGIQGLPANALLFLLPLLLIGKVFGERIYK